MFHDDVLICPKCAKPLCRKDNSLVCQSKHTFDIAKSGYVNLNLGSAVSGDSKEMVKARSNFLDGGYYEKFAFALARTLKNIPHSVIIDAGCGEGYYSEFLAKSFADSRIYGFDLSKSAVEKAAKRARFSGSSSLFTVCSIFNMPLSDGSADVIINLFAPCAAEEFFRILKPKGRLVMGIAGEDHLLGLKKALYDNVYLNNPEKLLNIPGFHHVSTEKIKYSTMVSGNETIQNLFAMTPYYWKTSSDDAKKLEKLETLETLLDFDIAVFERSEAL